MDRLQPSLRSLHRKTEFADIDNIDPAASASRISNDSAPMAPNGQGTAKSKDYNDDSVRQKVPLTQQQLTAQYKAQGRNIRNESVRLGGKRFRDEGLTSEKQSGEFEGQNLKGRDIEGCAEGKRVCGK
ncbi:hypothetical protein HYALB_00010785 [Hymenoscyphus albidus]|uniref:Uncharacterized protein n=1 Tax=Hymenoscyphus albidus TaxID=595503 RepID=A0A9N9LW81_9HELO|nr:hypothetical protein HYALB_00010785 [Hymenoscyphus albidus]